jgi:hypothetical protein
MERVAQRWWKEQENVREVCEYCEQQLGIKDKQEWYKVSKRQLQEVIGALPPLNRYSSGHEFFAHACNPMYVVPGKDWVANFFKSQVRLVVQRAYPDHAWEPHKFPNRARWTSVLHKNIQGSVEDDSDTTKSQQRAVSATPAVLSMSGDEPDEAEVSTKQPTRRRGRPPRQE